MGTSAQNKVSPNNSVTPDITIEIGAGKLPKPHRIVGEVKVNLPKDQAYWRESADQLKKYDDDLSGWDNPGSVIHDLAFITHELRTYAFNSYLEKLRADADITFDRNLAILHSNRDSQAETFITIKKDHGAFSNKEIDQYFANGGGVKLEHVVQETSQMKFCDYDPPRVYTMNIIWDHVLKNSYDATQAQRLGRNKAPTITVSIEDVRRKLARFAPEGDPNGIKREWVKEALAGFVELRVAKRISAEEGKYEIKFKVHKEANWILETIREKGAELAKKPSMKLDEFGDGEDDAATR
jgi:hypothetical protein